MGRKPKPPYLKLLTGNPGHRPIPDVITPEPVLPDPPDFLSDEAADEWRRLALPLSTLGLLSALDLAVFAAYCASYGIWRQATATLKDESLIVKSAKGNKMQNILIGIANKAGADMVRFASELGLSPSARAHLVVPPRSDPTDKYFR